MPEGPEVTITSQYLLSKLRNKIIYRMEIISGKYLNNKKLEGKKLFNDKKFIVKNVDSKGKLLWFKLQDDGNNIIYMISHFGLTGEWSFYQSNNDRIKFKIIDPTNNKIYTLYYSDDRNFGTIMLTDDKEILKTKQNKLAPDLLKTYFDENLFIDWIDKTSARKKMIVGKILMDQGGIGSGIGNYLCCEILYRAGISPHRTMGSLSKNDIKKLCYWIKYTMKLAYFYNITDYISDTFIDLHINGILSGKYPNFHPEIKFKNEVFEFLVYRRDKDNFGNPIKADKTVNKTRTTYWCPNKQV